LVRRGGVDSRWIGHVHLDEIDLNALGVESGLRLLPRRWVPIRGIDIGAGFSEGFDTANPMT
jgi:hypothetical protein